MRTPGNRRSCWLINATKQNITLVPGASIFHHADSFAMIRGGHLDLCVLGAYEVAENGDIANWATSANDTLPGVGGAMDLAAGSRQLWALMEHVTKDGRPRLVQRCNYPLTASGVVKRVYTNLAVIDDHAARLRSARHGAGADLRRASIQDRSEASSAGEAAPANAAPVKQERAPISGTRSSSFRNARFGLFQRLDLVDRCAVVVADPERVRALLDDARGGCCCRRASDTRCSRPSWDWCERRGP